MAQVLNYAAPTRKRKWIWKTVVALVSSFLIMSFLARDGIEFTVTIYSDWPNTISSFNGDKIKLDDGRTFDVSGDVAAVHAALTPGDRVKISTGTYLDEAHKAYGLSKMKRINYCGCAGPGLVIPLHWRRLPMYGDVGVAALMEVAVPAPTN
jgi:hypothetical protein